MQHYKALTHVGRHQQGEIIPPGAIHPDAIERLLNLKAIEPVDEDGGSIDDIGDRIQAEVDARLVPLGSQIEALTKERDEAAGARDDAIKARDEALASAKKAEEALEPFQKRNEDLAGQVEALTKERDKLKKDLETATKDLAKLQASANGGGT